MSEVKRFRADHRHVVETEFDDAQFVGVADFDRVTSERDAALNDVSTWKRKACESAERGAALIDQLDDCIRLSSSRELARKNSDLLVDALQQRLTAADERADVLEGLLLRTNELLYAIQGDPGAVPSSAIDAMRGEVFTALKSAESNKCPHSYHYFGDHPRRRCNTCHAIEPAEGGGDET